MTASSSTSGSRMGPSTTSVRRRPCRSAASAWNTCQRTFTPRRKLAMVTRPHLPILTRRREIRRVMCFTRMEPGTSEYGLNPVRCPRITVSGCMMRGTGRQFCQIWEGSPRRPDHSIPVTITRTRPAAWCQRAGKTGQLANSVQLRDVLDRARFHDLTISPVGSAVRTVRFSVPAQNGSRT